MPEISIPVLNRSGLHARPASEFVRAAAGFASRIEVVNVTRDPGRVADAKSILGVLGLGVSPGHEVRITAEGDDADAALAGLQALIASGLGEPSVSDAPELPASDAGGGVPSATDPRTVEPPPAREERSSRTR
jgi:phosphotransferase system HPr (HPr) family protein